MGRNNQDRMDLDQDSASAQSAMAVGTRDPNDMISRKLKALYSEAEQQAIPDRFLDLLEKLDAAERAANASEQK